MEAILKEKEPHAMDSQRNLIFVLICYVVFLCSYGNLHIKSVRRFFSKNSRY